MTCTIRNLKRSPTGRESIRERDFEGTEITFGRDAQCDVRFEDLSVALYHARLSYDPEGQIYLHIQDGQRVSVNNRIQTGTTGPLPIGSLIKIGVFTITLEAPSEKSDLVALVEENANEADVSAGFDEQRVFGLTRALPSKRLMAWVFSFAILFLYIFLPVQINKNPEGDLSKFIPIQADLFWNSGPLSMMHSNLTHDCASCHVNGWEAVKDSTCLDCHENLKDHAPVIDMKKGAPKVAGFDATLRDVSEAFGRPAERCSSCHVEHNNRAHILPNSQSLCTDCHSDLDRRMADTEISNVSDFELSHPQFRPVVITQASFGTAKTEKISLDDNPKGNSGLKFPHDIHLSDTGAVAKMAGTLGDRYGFADGVDCADCHRPEAGGALYDPVSMTNDCAMCHSIVFEDDGGTLRTLRHGEPEDVIASMRDFYDAKALANIRDAEMNSGTRRRPGRAASLRTLNRRELAFKQSEQRTISKVDSIFSEGGACYDCHVINRPVDISTLEFKVRPISISDAFYPRSPFNHNAHNIEGLSCESCHVAESSKTSDDILLPKINICRDCHISEASFRRGGEFRVGAFPTNCLTCHSFHDGPHAQETANMLDAAETMNE